MRTWLRELRKEVGLRQKDIARELGMTEPFFCLIENGKRKRALDVDTLVKIAQITKKDPMELLRKELDYLNSSEAH